MGLADVLSTACDCKQGGASAKDRINTLIAATNKHVAHAKALLQAMRDETAAMKKDPKKGSSANTRVRENLLNTFTRKFVDVAKEYQVHLCFFVSNFVSSTV
jgi:Syntaxin